MSWFYLCGNMLIKISKTVGSSNMMPNVFETILAFHAITGSGATSYIFRAGKVKIFKKFMSNQTKLKLFKELGKKDKVSDNHMKSAKEFKTHCVKSVRIRSYSGPYFPAFGQNTERYQNNSEYGHFLRSHVQLFTLVNLQKIMLGARVSIYKNLKRKTSMAIPPDPDSMELAIKRTHLQKFALLRRYDQSIQNIDPEEFGWKLTDDELKTLWFNVFTLTKMAKINCFKEIYFFHQC